MTKKLIPLFCLLLFILSASAQNGDISGKVKDERGEGFAFAKVTLLDTTGIKIGKTFTTDADGNYALKPLAPGKYNVAYSGKNYVEKTVSGIMVNADKSTQVDVVICPTLKEPKKAKVKSR